MEIEESDGSHSEAEEGGKEDCILCDEPLLNDIQNVSEKCRETLRKASIERKDSLVARFNKENNLQVHKKCYAHYTHSNNIAASLKKMCSIESQKATVYWRFCVQRSLYSLF